MSLYLLFFTLIIILILLVRIERSRLRGKLITQKEDIEPDSIARNRELLAHIAHDLRTPITSIHGYAETLLLSEDKISSDQKREYYKILLKNANLLSELVSSILDISKLETKALPLKVEEFTIIDLCSDLIARFRPLAQKKSVKLMLKADLTYGIVRGDIRLFERAIGNLIQNSIRYTPEGGIVELICQSTQSGEIRIAVRDNGRGIPDSEITHVCDPFYRVDKDRSKSTGGSGLGLAIVKAILNRHNLDLTITSKLGVGTEISFQIPKL